MQKLKIDKCSENATLHSMLEIKKTQHFADWLDNLKDLRGRARDLNV